MQWEHLCFALRLCDRPRLLSVMEALRAKPIALIQKIIQKSDAPSVIRCKIRDRQLNIPRDTADRPSTQFLAIWGNFSVSGKILRI
ncbi:MAG: hypothetical protein WBA89_06625 [Microcoleus sp.]|uniref:hypothetical protein n=1 Tax=Microcoleus sp. TaxID=44472 RepID=UPI003C7945A1